MRTGIGNVHDNDMNEGFFVVQVMGCIHTLIEHAYGIATIYKRHNSVNPILQPEDIRTGIIYEMISPNGIGEQLMMILAPIVEGADCAEDDVLQSIDSDSKAQLMRNVTYASSMLASARFEEYKDTLSDVAVSNCDFDSIIAGMPVAQALQAASMDTQDTEESCDSDSTVDSETPCQCEICQQWPVLEDRFRQWHPPPGLASICASAVDLIGGDSGSVS